MSVEFKSTVFIHYCTACSVKFFYTSSCNCNKQGNYNNYFALPTASQHQSACLSACMLKITCPNFMKFSVTLARSGFSHSAIHYVLLVFLITSCLDIVGTYRTTSLIFSWDCQQCLVHTTQSLCGDWTELVLSIFSCRLWVKSSVCNCLVILRNLFYKLLAMVRWQKWRTACKKILLPLIAKDCLQESVAEKRVFKPIKWPLRLLLYVSVYVWSCFSGKTLNIHNKLSLSSIQSQFVSRIGSAFSEKHEFIDDDVVQYAYSILRPTDSDASLFSLFIAYLLKSNAVCFIYSTCHWNV